MDERGSVLPLVGGLLFISLTMLAVALELGMLHATYRWSASTADIAAEAAASMIRRDLAYSGELGIDPVQAQDAAREAVRRLGAGEVTVDVEVGGLEACVTVTSLYRTTVLSLLGARTVDVRVRSCAVPAVG